MRKMKDSGIVWIGEIPEEWQVSRVGLHYEVILGKMLCPTQISDDYSLEKYYCAANVHFDGISDEEIKEMWFSSSEKEQYAVKEDDLLVVEGGAGAGGCAIVKHLPGPMYIQNSIMIVRGKNNHINSYLGFLIQCLVKMGYIDVVCNKATIPHFTKDKLSNIPYLISADQARIVSYLDTQCANIDTVIEKTRASIEEYKKLKQAVITQAVTKGIRPNRAMKDSGVEWIGEMPRDWQLIPFRHVLHERNEKNDPVKSTERLSLSIDLGVTLYAEKTTNLDRFKDDFEQYKIAHVGDLVMNSMNMIVGATGVSPYYGCVSPAYYTFYDETDNHITAKLCEYIFRSKTMLRVLFSLGKGIYAIVRGDDRVNTCRLKVSREDLRSIQIPLASFSEQHEIVEYLNDKCSAIDTLISKKEQYLTELGQLKKSLIYEYVTGKKEVPA